MKAGEKAMKKLIIILVLVLSAQWLSSCGSELRLTQTVPPDDSLSDTPIQTLENNKDNAVPQNNMVSQESDVPPDIVEQQIDTTAQTPEERLNTDTQHSGILTPLTSSGSGIPTAGPDETINIAGMFHFGMTLREVVDILFPCGVQDGDIYRTTWYSKLENGEQEDLDAAGDGFTFDTSGKLYYFQTSLMSTARGFTPGEDTVRMTELYGDDYRKYDSWFDSKKYICEYDFCEYFLGFIADYNTGIVDRWWVSKYSFEESWNTEGEPSTNDSDR